MPRALTFRSVLHPDECVPAIRESRRRISLDGGNRRWSRIRAEAYLCLGLADDPVALRIAIELFEAILSDDSDNLPARLGLAEALAKRAPLADETLVALGVAEALTRPTGSEWVQSYTSENRAALLQRREQIASLEEELVEAANPRDLRTLIAVDLEYGPSRWGRVATTIQRLEALSPGGRTARAWLAELLRQQGHYGEAARLFEDLLGGACLADGAGETDCVLARQKLTVLGERCSDWAKIEAPPASPCDAWSALPPTWNTNQVTVGHKGDQL